MPWPGYHNFCHNNILFKTIKKKNLPPYSVLCLPSCFAQSILMAFHDFSGLHVSNQAMLLNFNSLFFTPNIEGHFSASVRSCLNCFINNSRGIKTFRLKKRSLSNLGVGKYFQVDLVTGLPSFQGTGYHSLLLCVDVGSHYNIGRPIADHLQTTRYGCEHQSSCVGIVQLCNELDIVCVKSTPGSHNGTSSVGVAE